ncbi:MAG: hypothetical protein HZA78_13235 [Candidatus Schekmanbacteria bacterium]|nr:hypothetical protein [Candidatus Schekmanbacteria bacterium]
MQTKAIALLSGGLDSTLAVKLILDQGINVTAVNMVTPFCNCNSQGRCESKHVAEQFGIELKVFNGGDEYLEIVRNPKHGYGRNMNPCLDCRILLYKKAKQYMDETKAAFIFTGEVLGQRPMSQHKQAMNLIEKEAGLIGQVLRPLSARLLEPTIAEQNGLVDRSKLLEMQGRTRKPQMAMAEELGINDYPCPAGGCLLTDQQFAIKLRDLFNHSDKVSNRDMQMLKVGRHFRLNPQAKLIVGRDEAENTKIMQLANPGDLLFTVVDHPGPLALLRGEAQAAITPAASITARYSDGKNCDRLLVKYNRFSENHAQEITVAPGGDEVIAQCRI